MSAILAAVKLVIGEFTDSLIDKLVEKLEHKGFITRQHVEIEKQKNELFEELVRAQTEEEYHAIRRKINSFANQHSKPK